MTFNDGFFFKSCGESGHMRMRRDGRDKSCVPALSQMVVGMDRSARAKAAIARERLPGVRAPCSSTTCSETALFSRCASSNSTKTGGD